MFHGFAARVRVFTPAVCVARTTLQPLLGRAVQFDSETSVGPRILRRPESARLSAAPRLPP